MIILGLNGGTAMQFENIQVFGTGENHDAAAALIIDGKVVRALEEERLNRIKHTNKFPTNAIRTLLEQENLTLDHIDYFAVYATEEYIDNLLKKLYWQDFSSSRLFSAREYIADTFLRAFNYEINPDRICFVDHHTAHAASCFYLSGFEESLIITLDGVGCDISGRIMYGSGSEMINIDVITENNSLGHYYGTAINFIGYGEYEEYKVMGLAPYGNPSRFRDLFSFFYELLPEGKYHVHLDRLGMLYSVGKPRRKGQAFDQLYMDVAAALQESLENIVLHIAGYYGKHFGYKNLCLAGGVAHNCSANGKLLNSGLFNKIFVQPASHDAGNSVGAAICTYVEKSADKKIASMEHVLIGTDLEKDTEIEELLHDWSHLVEFIYEKEIEKKTASLIASGKIIGWVQGRSEFGPRALGNRSILADPRPAENKDIVNKMVKKREGYRPFAPSVISEAAHTFFELPLNGTNLDFMTFVVKVKEQYRPQLGAITHVDGTARIQTVTRAHNSKYWELITEFGKITGIPMLLNTSFNNNVEPIVNSSLDAVVCFLTTGLDYLVLGNYLVQKKTQSNLPSLNRLMPKMLLHTTLNSRRSFDSFDSLVEQHFIGFNYSSKYDFPISREVFRALSCADGKTLLADLISPMDKENRNKVLADFEELWSRRFIDLKPHHVEHSQKAVKETERAFINSH